MAIGAFACAVGMPPTSASTDPMVTAVALGGQRQDRAIFVAPVAGGVVIGGRVSAPSPFADLAFRDHEEPFFLARLGGDGATAWARPIGSHISAGAVAVDPSGDVVAVGARQPYRYNLVVTKLRGDGAPVFERELGGREGDAHGRGVAIDAGGRIAIAGNYRTALAFGDHDLVGRGSEDMFVAKLSPTGEPVWVRGLAGPGPDQSTGVAVDSAGGVVAGGWSGSAELVADGSTLRRPESSSGFGVVAKYDPDGALQWTTQLASRPRLSERVWVDAVAVDRADRIIVAGRFDGSLVGGGTTQEERHAAFAAALAPDGSIAWVRAFPVAGFSQPVELAVSPAGAIAIGATFTQAIRVGADEILVRGESDAFVIVLDRDGEPQRRETIGGAHADRLHGLAWVGEGLVALGAFQTAAEAGPARLQAAGGDRDVDVFVVGYGVVPAAGGTAEDSAPVTTAPVAGGFELVDVGSDIAVVTALTELPWNGGGVAVVGAMDVGGESHAFVWHRGRTTDLHVLLANDPDNPNESSIAVDIGAGIVGVKQRRKASSPATSWVYVNGGMTDWATIPDYGATALSAVNYQGEVIAGFEARAPDGYRKLRGAGYARLDAPVSPDSWTPVPRLDAEWSTEVVELNTDVLGNHAVFAGNAVFAGRTRAVVGDVKAGTIRALTAHVADGDSAAFAVNKREQVAGTAATDGVASFAPTVWTGDTAMDLSKVPFGARTGGTGRAVDINHQGVVVGAMGLHHDVVWLTGAPGSLAVDDMRAVRLTDILPPHPKFVEIAEVRAVNDAGVIVAFARARGFAGRHAVLLVPPLAAGPPQAPTGLRAAYGDRLPTHTPVNLAWSYTGDTELWFEIERRVGGGPWTYVGVARAGMESLDSADTLTSIPTEPIEYRVRAANFFGWSDYTNAAAPAP